jgi:FKBP-type peptidyl-prolyl cis-trans isomerase
MRIFTILVILLLYVSQSIAQSPVDKTTNVEKLMTATLRAYLLGKLNIQQTKSGLKYYVQRHGEGEQVIKGRKATVHYYGILLDGTAFDESISTDKPYTFKVGSRKVIKAWDEGLQLLNVGARAFFFCPPHLAYGRDGIEGAIPPDAELMFYIEVVE